MKKVGMIVAALLVSTAVLAQKTFDDEVNSELDKMYEQSRIQNAQPAQAVAQNAQPSTVQVNVQAQPQQLAQPVQKQPTTVIEASPLTESRVEKIRRARQESELQTEQKIVEKLETSRMEDEHKRASVLFGDKFDKMKNGEQQEQAPAPAPVVKEEPKADRGVIREEVTAALEEQKLKDADKKSERKTYLSLVGGAGLYSNNNIQSLGALGLGLGSKVNDHLMIEAQFLYSDYKVILPSTANSSIYFPQYRQLATNMQQYQGIAELKYAMFSGAIRPVLGAAVAYTYRGYDAAEYGYPGFGGSSNAFDGGLLGGADLEVSENMAVGLEGRYMWNMYYQAQANNGMSNFLSGTNNSPETMGYFLVGLTGRISF